MKITRAIVREALAFTGLTIWSKEHWDYGTKIWKFGELR